MRAVKETVKLRRSLVKTDPEKFNPDLANSLILFAICLSDIGHREEALAAVEEAIWLCQSLSLVLPEIFGPTLEDSLILFESYLSDSFQTYKATSLQPDTARLMIGHRQKAAPEKVVELRRSFAHPEKFNPVLVVWGYTRDDVVTYVESKDNYTPNRATFTLSLSRPTLTPSRVPAL